MLDPEATKALVKATTELLKVEEVAKTADSAFEIARQAFGALSDRLRIWRMSNFAACLLEFSKECKSRGIPPEAGQKISDKFLVPWIEGASAEDEPELQSLYGRLLAAESESRAKQAFLGVLKSVDKADLHLLEWLFAKTLLGAPRQAIVDDALISAQHLLGLGLLERVYTLISSEELRQLYDVSVTREGPMPRGPVLLQDRDKVFVLSALGQAFMNACIPDAKAFLAKRMRQAER